jgi:hypothetical protein
MAFLGTWRILEEIITEFRKEKVGVSDSVMVDLKSAKMLINVFCADQKNHEELSPKIEMLLANVESFLVTEGQKAFSQHRVDGWLKRLERANVEAVLDECEEPRFVLGMPRDQRWICVKPVGNLTFEKLKCLALESNLRVKSGENGDLVVFGNSEGIKEFVKKMTEQFCK